MEKTIISENTFWKLEAKLMALKDVLGLIDKCELKEGFNICPVELKKRING